MATNDKYDRQLRLWGANGQRALGNTTVILIRATACGTETLKNLVLPGVGRVLIVDDAPSVEEEFGSNFFLTKQAAQSKLTRAEVAADCLQELNPDVEVVAKAVPDSLEQVILQGEGWLSKIFSEVLTAKDRKVIVIGSDLEPPLLEHVSRACDKNEVPLIAVHSYGLIGMVRLQTPPLPLIDPKPSSSPPDLRLVKPFARLEELAASVQWDSLENHEHGHIPYPLILLRIASEWKVAHDGNLPKTPSEKQEFREAIKQASRNFEKELNFQEAVENAYLAYTERQLDLDYLTELRDKLNSSMNIDTRTPSILPALLEGLDNFLQRHQNQPPLHGTIPDMTASTDWYVKLQEGYHKQASSDLEEMRELVASTVSDEDLATFCQNCYNVDLLQTRTIEQEYRTATNPIPEELLEDLMMATFDPYDVPEHTPLVWYMGLRACQKFYQTHGRYPGVTESYQDDVAPLQEFLVQVAKDLKMEENDLIQGAILKNQNVAQEMTRYGNAEVHNIASVVGGVASQEAVKIITGQYAPLNNTFVYNGIASVGGVYQF